MKGTVLLLLSEVNEHSITGYYRHQTDYILYHARLT